MIFERVNKSCYSPAYSPQIAPIATGTNVKLRGQRLPLLVFQHILSQALVCLLPTARLHPENSHLGLLYLLFPTSGVLPACIIFHPCACCLIPLRSLFRSEGLFPQLPKVFPADGPQLSAPLGVASAKGSCLSQGHVSFMEQPAFND